MKSQANTSNRPNSIFRNLGKAIVSCAFALVSSVWAGDSGQVFWGSFGEGAGRVECAVFKGASSSEFIGFDAESETAFFSNSLNWKGEDEFEFNGVSIGKGATVSALGQGAAVASTQSVLVGSIEDSELDFETFANGSATFTTFTLVGQSRARVRVVSGDDGRCYALYSDARGEAFGNSAELDAFGLLELITPAGDVFQINMASEEGVYALADGRLGSLVETDLSSESNELNVPAIDRLWLTDTTMLNQETSSMHFILKGDGQKMVNVRATVSVLDADGAWFANPSLKIGLHKLGESDEYFEIATSSAFGKVSYQESSVTGALLEFSGNVDFEIEEGTYLVRIDGLYAAQAVNDLEVTFPEATGPRVVNASTLYLSGQVEEGRFFGFHLNGEGLAKTVIRNVGPSLSQFDLPSHTSDPRMAIYRDSVKTWKNDDWWASTSPAQLSVEMAHLGAFELEEKSKDASAKMTLESGDYEVAPQGEQKESAYELIEVYFD